MVACMMIFKVDLSVSSYNVFLEVKVSMGDFISCIDVSITICLLSACGRHLGYLTFTRYSLETWKKLQFNRAMLFCTDLLLTHPLEVIKMFPWALVNIPISTTTTKKDFS